MANYFPPVPVYPKSYDSDYTLYLVYNASETITTEDNPPWSSEIKIKPVSSDTNEVWAANGYANIDGELFYYDAVDYISYGLDGSGNEIKRINKFKRCARNLGGTHTKMNPAGSEVRGFVIAEHHNQIVDAIINVENFIGENFSKDKETLDWKIRHLQSLPVIFDDYTCPDANFNFYIESTDPATGIIAIYDIVIDGSFTSYRLDFGDGQFTTTSTTGTHRYALNANIDPILTLSNSKCTVVQTPIARKIVTQPPTNSNPIAFEIKIPEVPSIPPILIPTPPVCSNVVTPPPIVFPCLDIGPIGPINIPSIIIVEPTICIPSYVDITKVNIPSLINVVPSITVPSIVSFVPSFTIPSIITFVPSFTIPSVIDINIPKIALPSITLPNVNVNMPHMEVDLVVTIPDINVHVPNIPDIKIDVPIFPTIQFSPVFFPTVQFGPPPSIPVAWGSPPACTCTVTIACPSGGAFTNASNALDGLPDVDPIEVQMGDIGIPSEIQLKVPEIPDIRILHDIPAIIRVETPVIPDIKIIEPKNPIPSEIKIIADAIPSKIELDSTNLAKSIAIDSSDLPSSIKLEVPKEFPSIKIDASGIPDKIQVVGIPSTIELVGAPSEIKLVLPEKPEIELVYKGAPIDVKINLDISRLTGEDGSGQCVAIVPCGK